MYNNDILVIDAERIFFVLTITQKIKSTTCQNQTGICQISSELGKMLFSKFNLNLQALNE